MSYGGTPRPGANAFTHPAPTLSHPGGKPGMTAGEVAWYLCLAPRVFSLAPLPLRPTPGEGGRGTFSVCVLRLTSHV